MARRRWYTIRDRRVRRVTFGWRRRLSSGRLSALSLQLSATVWLQLWRIRLWALSLRVWRRCRRRLRRWTRQPNLYIDWRRYIYLWLSIYSGIVVSAIPPGTGGVVRVPPPAL